VRERGELRLYLNGRLLARSREAGNPGFPVPASTRRLQVGRGGEQRFIGKIEAVRVTRGARYHGDFPIDGELPMRPDVSTLCLLDLEEGEGKTARDSSGNGYDGTIEGADWEPMWPCPVPEKELRETELRLTQDNPRTHMLAIRASGRPGGLCLHAGYPQELCSIAALASLPLVELWLAGTSVQDLSPLRGMPLRVLNMYAAPLLKDLSPLRGMPLAILDISRTSVDDLSALRGAPLEHLCGWSMAARDLSPIADCPLRMLELGCPFVAKLPLFTQRKLQGLDIQGTQITDLSPLASQPLVAVLLPKGASDLSPLQSCPDLKAIFPPEAISAAMVKEILPQQNLVVGRKWDIISRLRRQVDHEIHRHVFPPK
jgi:hypothetical protein